MAGTARSNNPGRRSALADLNGLAPVGDVRELQRKLWAAAKQSPERRFHALYDRIFRGDVLEEAWRRVRANRGAAGVDRVTLAEVEVYGVQRMLADLAADLHEGRYRPAPARRVEAPKSDGGVRPLGIPTVRDRVAQQAAKIVLEPIFEAGFLPCSYGFRPRRSATQAMEAVRVAFPRGSRFVVEADIRSFFDSIDHDVVVGLVGRRVSDRRVLKLIGQWLRAGVMVDGRHRETVSGTPQGGVISPLLANIVLHELDRAWDDADGELVRYADDFVRHEALFDRVEMEGLHRRPVAAGRVKLGAARGWRCSRGWEAAPTTAGRAGITRRFGSGKRGERVYERNQR